MARRRIADEPTSRLAIWARRCAFFSLVATILSVIITRSGFVEIEPALATFAGALLFSVIGIVLALGAFVVVWKDGIGGAGYAFSAIGIGAILLAYPAYLGTRAYSLPMINDIVTDPIDPPRFDVIARLRPRGTVEYAGLYAAEQQRMAYPDIEPLVVTATPQQAYDAAMHFMLRRKWRVIVDRPPQAGRRDGQIEAVAHTAFMGFRDDVALRVRPDGEGARIDVRSASRYGRHDLGANASRIKSLLEEIDGRLATQRDAPAREQPQQKPPAKGQAPKR
ncbi:MAG: DUF1499 domain-containing protein [Alphaproteobacteria bacterium]|nr:DUF1499 domain-containing protein [Alphaproteobacteria bacterium]